MIYKNSEWYALLDDFADEVVVGHYKKTNYSAWRDMKNWKGAEVWDKKIGTVYTVEDIDCPFNYHDFNTDDGSFGQFLEDRRTAVNQKIEREYVAWSNACRNIDVKAMEKYFEKIENKDIKPTDYTIDENGNVSCYNPVTGEYVNVLTGDYTSCTATTSTEACSTASVAASSTYSTITNDTATGYPVNISGTIPIPIKPDTVDIKVDGIAMKADVDDVCGKFEELNKAVKELSARLDTKMDIEHYNNEKENKKMKMFGNFEFGKVDGNTVRMSMYGLAVRNANGTWVSYNTATGEVVDVDVMNFDGADLMYKMPVAIDQIKVGDVIIHARKPIYVTGIADGKLTAIDVIAGEEKVVLPTKNIFGFNFATKVVSLMDMSGFTKPSAENPFGNMWMLALMGDNKEFDFKDMLMMQMLSGQTPMNGMNPMLMLMLAKDGTADNDMMMALALSGALNPVATN